LAGEEVNETASLNELDVDGPANLELIARRFRYRVRGSDLRERVLAVYRQTRRSDA
jgi:hypothetical protein